MKESERLREKAKEKIEISKAYSKMKDYPGNAAVAALEAKRLMKQATQEELNGN